MRYNYFAAFINLLITLIGILFLHWNLQPIIYLFWIEVILNIISVIIRIIAALDGKTFFQTISGKLITLLITIVIGAAMIALAVSFTIGVFDKGTDIEGFKGISFSVMALAGNYLASLLINFFLSGKFRTANPTSELMSTVIYLLVLIVLIMAITQHLIPALHPENSSLWVGLAVIGVKFLVDFIAGWLSVPMQKQTKF